MCMGGSAPQIAAPPPPPPPPPPAPMEPDKPIVSAGQNARQKAQGMAGPVSVIVNAGGPAGLNSPPETTNKSQLG